MFNCRQKADDVFIKMTTSLALRSTCLDKQVGCLLVSKDNHIISSGYNGAPKNVKHCIDTKICIKDFHNNFRLCISAHAEQNALLFCKEPEKIYTAYLTLSPCNMCVNMLLNTPCQRVVFIHEHSHPEAKILWTVNKREWIHWKKF